MGGATIGAAIDVAIGVMVGAMIGAVFYEIGSIRIGEKSGVIY